MPGFTDKYSIPYPLPGDPVYLGADQMRTLAEKVDTVMGGVEGGTAGPPGPPGVIDIPRWETIIAPPKDERLNTNLGMGTGGYAQVRGRILAGIKYIEIKMRWGTNPSSSGGSVYFDLPAKWANDGGANNALTMERVGTGKYHNPRGGEYYDWPVWPWIGENGSRVYLLVPWYGEVSTLRRFRIWDGNQGMNTGFPFIADQPLDPNGAIITCQLAIPV